MECDIVKISPIDLARIRDAAQVVRDSYATVAELFALTKENAPSFPSFLTDQHLVAAFRSPKIHGYALVCKETMIGFCMVKQLSGIECEITRLCVLPTHRNRGFGHKLLLHAQKSALSLGCSIAKINVMEEYLQQKSWFEAGGFTSTGTLKFPAVVYTMGFMEKKL